MKHLNSKRNFLAVVAALLLTASAWAVDNAASGKSSIVLRQPASVAGTQLASGKYQVEWTANGEMANVKFFRGGKEVASTPARLTKFDPSPNDTVSMATDDKGAKSLTQISFGKLRLALRLGNEADAAAQRAAK